MLVDWKSHEDINFPNDLVRVPISRNSVYKLTLVSMGGFDPIIEVWIACREIARQWRSICGLYGSVHVASLQRDGVNSLFLVRN